MKYISLHAFNYQHESITFVITIRVEPKEKYEVCRLNYSMLRHLL